MIPISYQVLTSYSCFVLFPNRWKNWGLERLNDPPKTTQVTLEDDTKEGGSTFPISDPGFFPTHIPPYCYWLNFASFLGKSLTCYAHFHPSSSIPDAGQLYRALWTHFRWLSRERLWISQMSGGRIENNPNGLECTAEANMIKLYRFNIKTWTRYALIYAVYCPVSPGFTLLPCLQCPSTLDYLARICYPSCKS